MLCLTPFLRRLQQRSGYHLITARQGTPCRCLHLCCYLGTGLASLLGGGIQAAPWPGANTSTADGRVPPGPQGHCRRRAALLPSTPQRALLFLATVSVYDAADLPGTVHELRSNVGVQGSRVTAPHSAASRLMGTDHNRTLTGCPYESAILLIHPVFIFLNFLKVVYNLKTIGLA